MERNIRPSQNQEPHILQVAFDSEVDRTNLWPDEGPRLQLRSFAKATERFEPTDHDLTLIVPAYNEENRLPATLAEIQHFFRTWPIEYRVIIANDGSRDCTSEVVHEFGFPFSVIDLPVQSGKGCAVRTAMLSATGRVVAFTDADLPFGLNSLREAYYRIDSNQTEIVFGARDTDRSSESVSRRWIRRLTTYGFRQIVRTLISRDISDTQCGLKVFSRHAALEIFDRATVNGFAFDAEVILLTHRLGLPYEKIAVRLINDVGSTVSLRRHALPMLGQVFRIWNQARKEVFELEQRFDLSWNQISNRPAKQMNESIRRAA